jgi:hypothetical protein
MSTKNNDLFYENAINCLNDICSTRIIQVSEGIYYVALLTKDQEIEFQILENSESSSLLPCVFMSSSDDYYYHNFLKRLVALFSVLKIPLSIKNEVLESIEIWATFRDTNPVVSGYLKTVLFPHKSLDFCIRLSLIEENDDRSIRLL